jgi:hypothetical protein
MANSWIKMYDRKRGLMVPACQPDQMRSAQAEYGFDVDRKSKTA